MNRLQSSQNTSLLATDRVLQRKCACGFNSGKSPCTSCLEKKQYKKALRKDWTSKNAVQEVPDSVYDVLRSSGQPLDSETRATMESRFGHDFSNVRVHVDARAAHSAIGVNAQAYTVGREIVFGEGMYQPRTSEGSRLLAHELTHVVQQGARPATNGGLKVGPANSAAEIEAHQNADRINTQSQPLGTSRKSPLSVQRAAPVAAVGIGALAAKCMVGAIVGVLFDFAIQSGLHMWRRGKMTLEGLRVDYCSIVLSAVLGCIGGVVAAKWLEPWINSRLGSRLGGLAGSLIGRILLFIANKLGIGIPRTIVKKLLHLGCISEEQGEVLAPGVSGELVADVGELSTVDSE